MNEWLQEAKTSVESLSGESFRPLQAFVEDKSRLKINLEDGRIDEVLTGRESGLALSAVDERNTNFFCYASPRQVQQAQAELPDLLGVSTGSEDISWNEPEIYEMDVESALDVCPSEEKKERVLEADRCGRSFDDRVDQVRVTYNEKNRRISVVDQSGWIREEQQQYINFNVMVIARENGRRERGHSRLAGYRGNDIFDDKSPRDVAVEAAEQAVTALEAEPVDPGPRTVVIAPGFGGTIFHEACGHGFEADHVFEDVSQYAGRMGEEVASELVTFVDQGSVNNEYGSFRIDD
jgi:TldD protein